ncbi:Histocompatibility 2, M region locus 11 [Apodemus speciosus]|uniref:Histocompatibility 2, M region locus 11 n=1 Tax=Apodemus speciosus TaxID=105296 RepID=A0ABQ0FPF2_APOSI
MRYGCYVLLQGDFSHAVLELSFNDHDYVRLNEGMETWTTVGKLAEMLMEAWASTEFIHDLKTNLVSGCVEVIFRELEYGKEFFLRKEHS